MHLTRFPQKPSLTKPNDPLCPHDWLPENLKRWPNGCTITSRIRRMERIGSLDIPRATRDETRSAGTFVIQSRRVERPHVWMPAPISSTSDLVHIALSGARLSGALPSFRTLSETLWRLVSLVWRSVEPCLGGREEVTPICGTRLGHKVLC